MIRKMDKQNTVVMCLNDAKEWCESMAYSPNETKLAVGSHDNYIYIYSAFQEYQLLTTCTSHHSYITCLDWSADGNTIRTNCGAYELLFFNVPDDSKQQKMKNNPSGASSTKNEQWATQSCKLGWAVQGIYPPGVDGTHVNGVDTLF